jgi:hypothetical protein
LKTLWLQTKQVMEVHQGPHAARGLETGRPCIKASDSLAIKSERSHGTLILEDLFHATSLPPLWTFTPHVTTPHGTTADSRSFHFFLPKGSDADNCTGQEPEYAYFLSD